MASHVTEIARQDGAESCSMHLALEHDGGIKMDAQDIGPTVTQIWGDDDYEILGACAACFGVQTCLRIVAREVLESVRRCRCVS